MSKKTLTLTPVKLDSRVSMAVAWYATEEEADVAGRIVRERGDTYNGGYMHGMSCGRARGFDGPTGFAITCMFSAPSGEFPV